MTIRTAPRQWHRYAALGDSFTEGLCDDLTADGRHRGWADRVAQALADRSDASRIEYANLAIRGRLAKQAVAEQVPAAVALGPDLTSLAIGVNDTLRRRFSLDASATAIEGGVRRLRAAGSDVLLFGFGDPARRSRVIGSARERIQAFNSAVEAIARHYDCYLVRYWDVAALDDDMFWAEDRLHLSPEGHALIAESVLEALGLGGPDWRTPVPPSPGLALPRRAVEHARWAGNHLAPWAVRRLRGASSGDGVTPKHPDWVWVEAGAEN